MNELTLEKRIYNDYVTALKSKDKERAQLLNFIRAAMKYIAIDLKKDVLSEEEIIGVLKKNQKQITETKESGIAANKQDIILKAEKELSIIAEYLPKPMDESQLINIIDQVIAETGAVSQKDMGKVMKEVLAKVGISADARKTSSLVKERLSSI
ncbi:MAG: GatB/YqeY domain-containing protein [Candidatus Omnitrophica bacterium]|nr:GatB/YqeY domain-containing protein [Candidatus Omnitrophota bacterium]